MMKKLDDSIKKQIDDVKLINPLIMSRHSAINGTTFNIIPIYAITDNILGNYMKNNIPNDRIIDMIRNGFINRIDFLFKDIILKVMKEVQISLMAEYSSNDNLLLNANEICYFPMEINNDKNALDKYINYYNLIDIINESFNINNLDIYINSIVENVYNFYIMKTHEYLYISIYHNNIKFTVSELEVLYNIPTIFTRGLGIELGVMFIQFLEYKNNMEKIIKPK